MASPLLEFANARVRIAQLPPVDRDFNGRFINQPSSYWLLICYMKRVQYTGVSSGSRKIPLPSELDGQMLPGASGDEFYYRGYALEKASIISSYDWKKPNISDLTFLDMVGNELFLHPQSEVEFLFGSQAPMKAVIQRSNGKFGGTGIDEIIYPAIGIEFQLTGAEVLS
ncbi:MAG: hypothetical protein ACO236_00920 [Candidatus Nanopelagicaceae bacterium]